MKKFMYKPWRRTVKWHDVLPGRPLPRGRILITKDSRYGGEGGVTVLVVRHG